MTRTVLCTLLLVTVPAVAPVAAQEDTTIRAETRAVQISVSVRSKDGAHIAHLKREDFRITDNGKRREVQFFSPDDAQSPPPRPQPNIGPGVYTNRFSPGGPGRITAILLDGLNTDFEDQSHARQQAIAAVDRMTGGESIAIYSLKTDLSVLQSYTTDRTLLLAALKRFKPSIPMLLPKSVKNPYGAQHKNAGGDPDPGSNPALTDYQNRRRIEGVMESLNAIADHMRGATGRKSILWITGGFAHDEDLRRLMRGSLNRVNDANVALYPVDARGLITASDAIDNIMLMQEFAAATGGRAYYNRNDLGTAIVDALADSSTSYSMGFYLNDKDLDGQFHDLKVSVAGHPELELHYRKGYTAVKEPKRKKDEDLSAELLDPVNATDIGIEAKVERKGKSIVLTMVLDGSYSVFEELFVQTNVTGLVVAKQHADAKLSDMRPGVFPKFTQTIPMAAGADKLTVVVRDTPSGRVGSLTIPLGK
jgi:VWFA-related protein